MRRAKHLAGPRVGEDVARAVIGVASEARCVFRHACDPVGKGIIAGDSAGCHSICSYGCREAVANTIIGVARIAP